MATRVSWLVEEMIISFVMLLTPADPAAREKNRLRTGGRREGASREDAHQRERPDWTDSVHLEHRGASDPDLGRRDAVNW
jgi:hypothetical protein